MDRLAGQVRRALEAADLDAYARLLDRGVRWGPPGDPVPPCRSRAQVLTWYRRSHDAGARARVTETLVAGDKILVGLTVTGPADADAGARVVNRWQVLTVRGGRITGIAGFAERDEAAIWAGVMAARPAPPGSIRWAVPRFRLADDKVGLHLPELADADILHGYAGREAGLDGDWVPLPARASLADCRAVVRDWLAGWRTMSAASMARPWSSPRSASRAWSDW
jgi:ketosteroid isomerase-like protein